MPPEVFNEIVTHLFPMDLSSLARSNKFFRMSRTSLHLWRQALENAPEIPSCPPGLNEPQYVSLLFSKSCSSCGARVLRQMDSFLHVRLCNSCRDEQTMDLSEDNPLLLFLPRSIVIKDFRDGVAYTLKGEFSKIRVAANKGMEEHAFAEWQKERYAQVCRRHEHGLLIVDYLDMIEAERIIEVDELKRRRQTQIETRLFDEGWSKKDMIPSLDNRVEWNKLMSQPKPITDHVWTNLRPKLEVLLESNRVYHGPAETEKRRRERIDKLHALVSKIQQTLPPFVRFEFKPALDITKLDGHDTPRSNILDNAFSSAFVGEETLLEDVETNFGAIRDEFDQAVVEWREKVERDLVEIWNADRNEQGEEPSTSKGKGKQIATPEDCGSTTLVNNCTANPAPCPIELVLSKFVATYTKSDGTTTMDISDLFSNLKLLLRADTIFRSTKLLRTYPGIVPSGVPHQYFVGRSSEFTHGRRWDPSTIKRDYEASAIAKEFLVLAGRSEASSVYMEALGKFKCGRCNRARVDSWEDLIRHYTTEQGRWRKAKAKIKAETKSGFVFNSTHQLEPGNRKPFAHLMAGNTAIEYMEKRDMFKMLPVKCIRCGDMGIRARYSHSDVPSNSPIEEHLRNVHDVDVAKAGVHFRECYFESDEGSEDTEE